MTSACRAMQELLDCLQTLADEGIEIPDEIIDGLPGLVSSAIRLDTLDAINDALEGGTQ